MNKIIAALPALALAAIAAPTLAADLPGTVVAAPAAPAAAPTTTTLALEVSPEFYTLASSSHNAGDIADWYAKGTVSYAIAPGWTIAAAGQYTAKPPANGYYNLYVGQVEGSAAYKFKLTDSFSITGTAGLGYAWGNTGYVDGVAVGGGGELGNDDDSFGYYFVQASLDYKLDSHWTWNVVQARYRNAFTETWITPKVATGITYAIDANDAVYASVGYAWKDKGDGNGLQADKYNVAVGYKYSF